MGTDGDDGRPLVRKKSVGLRRRLVDAQTRKVEAPGRRAWAQQHEQPANDHIHQGLRYSGDDRPLAELGQHLAVRSYCGRDGSAAVQNAELYDSAWLRRRRVGRGVAPILLGSAPQIDAIVYRNTGALRRTTGIDLHDLTVIVGSHAEYALRTPQAHRARQDHA